MLISHLAFLQTFLLLAYSASSLPVYSASCSTQSVAPRICPYTNYTEYLLTIKKGGTNILSTNNYDPNFFLCQQYNYDCGYVQNLFSPISISDGIQLTMSSSEIDALLPVNTSLASKIKPYLNVSGQQASCGMGIFPLVLSSSQSSLVFNNYMSTANTKVSSQYTSGRTANASAYSDLNMNIKSSVLETVKNNPEWDSNSSQYWNYFLNNQFTNMSQYLKSQYEQRNQLYLLHSAYLIQSVSAECNRYQAVNFLIDQSGSITASSFTFALQFLSQYVNQTNDDPTLMSINFYSTTFQEYVNYGNNKTKIINMINSKTYPGGGTLTGSAINKTTLFIKGSNLPTGIPKIMVILTDGNSYDDVILASNYARSNGISLIAVGIGPNVNQTQLLQIAQTPSNMILITKYSQLKRLVDYIANYFCKQIVTININQSLQQGRLKIPTSPNYYRIKKDSANYLKLQINYQTNPGLSSQQIYQSQVDPFPDAYTQYTNTGYSNSTLKKTYFIEPVNQANVLLKKNIYVMSNASSSYLSIGANQLKFNISLGTCTTTTCTAERLAAGIPVAASRISKVTKQNTHNLNQPGTSSKSAQNQSFPVATVVIFSLVILIGFVFIIYCVKSKINSKVDYEQDSKNLDDRIEVPCKLEIDGTLTHEDIDTTQQGMREQLDMRGRQQELCLQEDKPNPNQNNKMQIMQGQNCDQKTNVQKGEYGVGQS